MRIAHLTRFLLALVAFLAGALGSNKMSLGVTDFLSVAVGTTGVALELPLDCAGISW